jgi:hypothetical protein
MQTTWILFLDIVKAFGTVDRHWLWKALARVGMPAKMISVLRSLYTDPTGELTMEGVTRAMKFGGGSGQGKILAPRLFSFFLCVIFQLWIREHPEALQTLLCGEDEKMTGRKWTEGGLPLLCCLFNLADDTAMLFPTKTDLTMHGFALMLLLRDFGLDTHLSSDKNPAPKTAAMCIHPRTVLNHLKEYTRRHRAKVASTASANRTTAPATFVSTTEPPAPIEILPFDSLTHIPVVDNYIYVGSNVAETLSDAVEVHRKLRSASFLRPRVLGPSTTSTVVKKTVYESVVLGVLLHGSGCWTLNTKLTGLLENFHHRVARNMGAITLRHTRKCSLTTATLLRRIGLSTMQNYLDKRMLGWAGHMARMLMTRWPRKMLTAFLPHPRPFGAPPKTHGRCLVAALTRKGIPVASWIAIAQNRADWRSATHTGLPHSTTATNYIFGRSVLACAGSSLEGIVTGKTCSNEGPSWIIALENGRSTCMESRAIKP